MKHFYLLLGFLLTSLVCFSSPIDPDKPVYVTVKTSMGNVTVILYDDTPLHRDNFIKLCQENAYDGVLFHRIIKDFVVQGGDPNSKAQQPGVCYGNYSGGYTIPAEIRAHYFNKRGALIDAKQIDDVNPERASAGTQFCFLQGKVFTDDELAKVEVRINQTRDNWLFHKYCKELKEKEPTISDEDLNNRATIMKELTTDVLGPYVIPEEHRRIYRTIGGSPHLDGSLTIFGEVVEGLDIVEKMSLVTTNEQACPVKNVSIISTTVFQK